MDFVFHQKKKKIPKPWAALSPGSVCALKPVSTTVLVSSTKHCGISIGFDWLKPVVDAAAVDQRGGAKHGSNPELLA